MSFENLDFFGSFLCQDKNEYKEKFMFENESQKNIENSRSLFVVGDDAQSIYGFRGSKIELILSFHKFYPEVKEIMLNQNYRSTQPILDLAEQVLSHNQDQKKKNLFTNNPQSNLFVYYYLARNERDEADFIVKRLSKLANGNNFEPQTSNSDSSPDSNSTTKTRVDFVPDSPEVENSSQKPSNPVSAISSMFDIYLDANELNTSDFGNSKKNLWSQVDSFSGYNSSSWQVPNVNWSRVEELNNVAILYRTHSQSRAIEETFLKYKIPYKLVSGIRFLDRKEVRDVLAMLKYIANPSDKLSLARFLPLILNGVGPKTLEKIYAWLEDPSYPLPPKFQEQVNDTLIKFQKAKDHHERLIDFTKEVITTTGYLEYLKDEYPIKEEFTTRSENIAELYSLMLPFDEGRGDTNASSSSGNLLSADEREGIAGQQELSLETKLTEFLSQILLMSGLESKESLSDNTPKVSLMTLHQSKGLEFDTVFLVGCEDGLLPHQNSLFEPGGLDEEVRLAYVGITRAKRELYLTAADSRVQFGQIKANPVSRIFRPFLDSYAKRTKG